jgi:hypothetical protein
VHAPAKATLRNRSAITPAPTTHAHPRTHTYGARPQEVLEEGGPGQRGRITVYCVAESVDRKALELRLRARGASALLHQYPDVLYGQYAHTVRQRV